MDLLAEEKGTVASVLSVRELLSKIKLVYSPIKPPLTLNRPQWPLKSQKEGLNRKWRRDRETSDVLCWRSSGWFDAAAAALQFISCCVSCEERLFLYSAWARATAAKNRSRGKRGRSMRDGGEGRGNVTVNMGQLSLSFLSLFVSYSRLTLDFLQTDQRKVSFFTRTQKRSTSFVFLLHSSSFFFFFYLRDAAVVS